MKKGKKRVIPGFGLTMGVTITMLSIVVLTPLASLVVYSSQLGLGEFFEVITEKKSAFQLLCQFYYRTGCIPCQCRHGTDPCLGCSVRYEFPGKRIMDGMIELPFALPTAVPRVLQTDFTRQQIRG